EEVKKLNKLETRGMRNGWYAGVEALMTVIRVLPSDLYERVMSGQGEVPPGASVPGGTPGKMPGHEHHHGGKCKPAPPAGSFRGRGKARGPCRQRFLTTCPHCDGRCPSRSSSLRPPSPMGSWRNCSSDRLDSRGWNRPPSLGAPGGSSRPSTSSSPCTATSARRSCS